MLRIGARKPPVVAPEEAMPTEQDPMEQIEAASEPEVMADEPQEESYPLHFVDKNTAGYMGPEFGPFQCQRCCHFQPDGSCGVVEGPIDPEGCCNLYCPPNHGGEEAGYDESAGADESMVPDEGYKDESEGGY